MDERARGVLEERARKLARPLSPRAGGELLEVVTFALAGEVYAVESRYVFEVLRLTELALLPGAAPPVFGLTAWRGGLLTVFDLRPLLGLPAAALDDLGQVVVLGRERPEFGVLADAVREVLAVPVSEVREAPEGVAVKRDFLRGVTGHALMVLDGERLLSAYA